MERKQVGGDPVSKRLRNTLQRMFLLNLPKVRTMIFGLYSGLKGTIAVLWYTEYLEILRKYHPGKIEAPLRTHYQVNTNTKTCIRRVTNVCC